MTRAPSKMIKALLVVGVLAACGPTGPGGGGAGGGGGTNGGGSGGGTGSHVGGGSGHAGGTGDGGYIDPNAFWANDPPPMWCGPDGGATAPTPPGGTPECPDDKNRQGCPCTTVGQMAPCWPGLRVNRNLGACRDGTTTCTSANELQNVWGECMNYVLPTPGVTRGPEACHCFSSGQWALANLSPCFVSNSSMMVTGAVSTYVNGGGTASCPSNITMPPTPQPGSVFSTDTLKVDCAGHFKICFELKAGSAADAGSADCSMAKVCTEGDYTTPGQTQTLPPLPSWVSDNPTCAAKFATTGGYGEMSVTGESVACDVIDDGSGQPFVFNRVQYCPLSCNTNPNGPGCANCMQGGGGSF